MVVVNNNMVLLRLTLDELKTLSDALGFFECESTN